MYTYSKLLSWSPPPYVIFTSTSRPPCVHLTSLTWWMRPGLPHFSHPSASVYYTERKPKNTKRGRPGNEARLLHCKYYYQLHVYCCFSRSSTDLDVQEPTNIQRVLLDAVKRGNVVKVSSVIVCISQFNSHFTCKTRPNRLESWNYDRKVKPISGCDKISEAGFEHEIGW